jgi:hypothetical protein
VPDNKRLNPIDGPNKLWRQWFPFAAELIWQKKIKGFTEIAPCEEKIMRVSLDIEIRELIREESPNKEKFIRIVIFEVEIFDGKERRSVSDIVHIDDYTTTVSVLSDLLKNY